MGYAKNYDIFSTPEGYRPWGNAGPVLNKDGSPIPEPTYACKHCGEPIRRDGLHAQYVHIANPKINSWYTYCEMNRNHADHTTSGKLTSAEPKEAK